NGAIDATFGNAGRVNLPFSVLASGDLSPKAIARPNGKIVIVAFDVEESRLVVLRVTESGQLDESFGEGGVLSLGADVSLTRFALTKLPDGQIVVATWNSPATNMNFIRVDDFEHLSD